MKHPTSRMLHAYWDRVRGERCAPERAEIEPGEIRHLLADSLILELDVPHRAATLRLAGTRVCALFGRELRAQAFGALWGTGAAEPWRMVEIVAGDAVGVVAGLRGTNAAGEALDLELLLLPLRHRGRTQARALGTLSPVRQPAWLGLRPLMRLETTSMRVLSGAVAAPDDADVPGLDRPSEDVPVFRTLPLPSPANDADPVRRGHLLVHRGGRA
ncbi:PAS domain-containing protein [uncultured Methylobacterium sp.]|uniref:PAS domain-containing protein n=1 Tax=uncultured Methylobacterium sp. TaxID=157278 RepID=UPI0035CBDF15